MSHQPLTPKEDASHKKMTSQVTSPSAKNAESATKIKTNTLCEPSPASTYGDTARSNSPATPLETGGQDIAAGITQSMRAAQLDPAIKSISESPMSTQNAKYGPTLVQHGSKVTFNEAYTSPSRSGGNGETNRASSTSSSPLSGRAKAIRSAPTWRGGHGRSFVHTTGHGADDPFVSAEMNQQSQSSDTAGALVHHPDRIGVTPTNVTAQAIFSPLACVFVANLTQTDTDDQLEHAVTEAFQQFGDVYVKIRRDGRQMPFAFAQYTNVDDAQRAITHGRGLLINGRSCRTEVARVNRSLYLSKINGGLITEDNAREVMANFGPIEMLWFASQTEREMFGLPDGIFVRFAFFDDCRSAQVASLPLRLDEGHAYSVQSFRDSSAYRLEQVKGLEEIRALPNGRLNHSKTSPFRRETPGRMISPAAVRRTVDTRSIFVGNIPHHITEEQLGTMFQMYGRVTHCEIIRKPSLVNASGINVFAFIEYEYPQAALLAVQASPRAYHGLGLRVEHKEQSNFGSRGLHNFAGSPHRIGALDSQEVLAAFQRGVSMGMNQAQVQMIPPPVYSQYPYYAGYDSNSMQHATPAATSGVDVAASPQAYGNGYVAPTLNQFQYPANPPTYVQYQQAQQPYIVPNPTIPHYQWPLANAGSDNTSNEATSTHQVQ